MDEAIQFNADRMRMLEIGLWSHDPEIVSIVFNQLMEAYGPDLTREAVTRTITRLMNNGWSFFNEETGEVSPLM